MVAGLTHPNIVQIFDLGKIDKSYYIAMEYVRGRDLRTILRTARERGLRLPLDLSVLIVSRVDPVGAVIGYGCFPIAAAVAGWRILRAQPGVTA